MIDRQLNLAKILGKTSSAFLFGARGVGKTHLAQQYLRDWGHSLAIDLLDPMEYARFVTRPQQLEAEINAALKHSESLLVLVDEVQKLPQLLDVVHMLIERHKPRLQFLLTGSSARKLKRGGANLLAGRALDLRLHPLTQREIESANIEFELDKILQLGSLPGILLDNHAPEMSLKSYVANYLKEEIQAEALVRKIDSFARFIEIAGQYHGEEVNASSISRAVGVSPATVQEYFQILEDTLIAIRLPGWSASVKKQLRIAPKYYLFDNGVANTLRGELRTELRESSSRYGKLFEALIIQEIQRMNDYSGLDFKLSYWKTNNGQEVDLIISRGTHAPLVAIEIKSSTAPQSIDFKGLAAFVSDYPGTPCYCFSRTPRAYITADNVEVMPWKAGLAMLETL